MNTYRSIVVIGAASIANAVIYLLFSGAENFFIFGDAASIFFSSVTAVAALYAFMCHGATSSQGKALLFLTLGGFSWMIAEILWGVQEILLNIYSPEASVSDIFYLGGYLFMALGLLCLWKITGNFLGQKRRLGIVSVIAAIFFVTCIYVLLPAAVSGTGPAEIIAIGYVVLDFVLILLGVAALPVVQKSRASLPWLFVITGIVLTAVGDIFYNQIGGDYVTGMIPDLFWDAGYLMLFIGFVKYRENVLSLTSRTGRKRMPS